MRVFRKGITTAIVLLVLCNLSFGSGFEITGIGAKARGMGGAFRGVADDWTAAYYNPAGYSSIADNSLSVSWAFLENRNELDPGYSEPSGFSQPYQWGHFNDRTIFNLNEILNNPSFGLVLRTPFWGETVFGLSIYQPFDNAITWNLFDGLSAYNRLATLESGVVPGEQYKNDLDVVAFQLTAGREFVADKLSLGIGLQLLRVDLLYKDLFLRENPLSAPFNDRVWDRIPQFITNEGSGYGFGIKGGLMWKPTSKFSVGISGSLPFEITVDGDLFSRYILPDRSTTSGLKDANGNDLQPGGVEFLFVNGGVASMNANFETKIQLPPSLGIGLAYQLTDKLLLAVDAEYTLWSQYEGLSFAFNNFTALPAGGTDDSIASFFRSDLARPVIYDDVGKVMGGLKYDVSQYISFVGGVSVDQGASENFNDLTPQFFDIGTKHGFNGGILATVDRWDVGLITSYIKYDDLTINGLQDIDGDGTEDNFPGNFRADTYETVVSVNYRF